MDDSLREMLKTLATADAKSVLLARIALMIGQTHLLELARIKPIADSPFMVALEHVQAALDVLSGEGI